MKLLVDTHVFLWALMDTEKLSPPAVEALLNQDNQIHVSAVSFWEISLKYALGKLELSGLSPAELPGIATKEMGLKLIALDAKTAASLGTVEKLHNDPFDRMLIHQAIENDFTLVSADQYFSGYQADGLKLLW